MYLASWKWPTIGYLNEPTCEGRGNRPAKLTEAFLMPTSTGYISVRSKIVTFGLSGFFHTTVYLSWNS
jgi:hypothetical protein